MLLAVILAGGRGARLGGTNKALIRLAGRPLIRHVIDRIAGQADAVVVNCAGGQAEIEAFGLPIAPDAAESEPLPGVFRGLYAALRRLGESPAQWTDVLTVPTDTPFLPRRLAAPLAEAAGPRGAAFAADALRAHAVIGLWSRVAALNAVAALADYRNESVQAFARAQGAVAVPIPLVPGESFQNVNTAEDLRAAEAFAAGL